MKQVQFERLEWEIEQKLTGWTFQLSSTSSSSSTIAGEGERLRAVFFNPEIDPVLVDSAPSSTLSDFRLFDPVLVEATG